MGTRFAARAKRRRINRWLNGAIAVVVLLILIVGGNLLFGDQPSEKAVDREAKTEAANAKRVEVETGEAAAPAEAETPAEEEDAASTDETSEAGMTETPGPPGSTLKKKSSTRHGSRSVRRKRSRMKRCLRKIRSTGRKCSMPSAMRPASPRRR